MNRRSAIAQYEATIVLVVISLALASVVYSGLKGEANVQPEPVFTNSETGIGGGIERVIINSSSPTTGTSVMVDSASSSSGILAFNGAVYSTSTAFCDAGETTFFSVLATHAGSLEVTTNGAAWIAGTWGSVVRVSAGWQEIMIQGGTTCSIVPPGSQPIPSSWTPTSSVVSSIPVEGALSGAGFTLYLPTSAGGHQLLFTSSGGLDELAL